MKHVKHAILRSTPSTLFFEARDFYEARQARKHAKSIEHARTPST